VSLRAALAPLAALLGLLVPAPASAQQTESRMISTPAEKFVTAPGGVDLRTGRYAYSETDLSIGGEGESGGLSLTRIMTQDVAGHVNPFGNLSHNWDVMVTEKRVAYDDPDQAGPDYRIYVHFGGRSMTYMARASAPGFQQLSPTGYAPLTFVGDKSSPSVVYTYTAVDGTVAVFRPLGGGDCSTVRRCAYVSEIVEADGTRFTFSYASIGPGVSGGDAQLVRVTSSRGYALLLRADVGQDHWSVCW
jgi:hypothetical protein